MNKKIKNQESFLRELANEDNKLNEKIIAGFMSLVMSFIVILFISLAILLGSLAENISPLVKIVGLLLTFTVLALGISSVQNITKFITEVKNKK